MLLEHCADRLATFVDAELIRLPHAILCKEGYPRVFIRPVYVQAVARLQFADCLNILDLLDAPFQVPVGPFFSP